MRKIYFLTGRLSLISIFCMGAFALTTSCVNDEYDLSDGIDMNLSVGGSLTLPLGTTAPITLGDMLDVDQIDMLEEINGEYKITTGDKFSISIDKIAGQNGLSFSAISPDPEIVESDFEKPEFPSFGLDVAPQVIDATPDVESVAMGEPTELDEVINALPTISSSVIPTIPDLMIDNVEIPIEVDETPIELTVADGISCPEQVVKVSDIVIGSEVQVTFDVSMLADKFIDDTFDIDVPYVELTFPEGFVIDGGDNVVRKENLTNDGGSVVEFSFTIDGYEGELMRRNDGYLDSIEGEIKSDISDVVYVSGTTSGGTSAKSTLELNISSMISVSDMTLEIADMDIEVNPEENLSEEIKIENIPDLIRSVSEVTISPDNNSIDINVSYLEIPEGLVAEGSDIELRFPVDKFVLVEDKVVKSGSSYVLYIPIDEIVGSDSFAMGYSESVEIVKILFEGDIIEGEESNYLPFDPEITMQGTTVTMEGAMQLNAFNDFIAANGQIEVEVEADQFEIAEAEIEINDYVAEFDQIETEISESIELPEELKRIDSMLFREPVYIDFAVDVALSGTDADLSFEGYTIEFPRFLKFAEGVAVDDDNVMLINDTFDVTPNGRSYSVQFEIEKLDFTDEQYRDLFENMGSDNILEIDEAVKLSGGVKMASSDIDSSELNDTIEASVSFGINEMEIAKVYGIVDPEVAAEADPIDLSALSEMFEGEFSAELSNPTITITATNTLEIPLMISTLELQPSKAGENLTTLSIDSPIEIEPAHNGMASTTTIYISANDNSSNDTTYEKHVMMNNLKSILAGMPDKIELDYEVGAMIRTGENHMIDLYTDYEFGLEYNIDVPLRFDELTLDYSYEMEDFGESLGAIVDMVESLELEMNVQNDLPISLTIVEMKAYDEDDNLLDIPSIFAEGENIMAANGKSTLTARLANNENDDLSRVDDLEIHIAASIDSTEGGAALTADQALVIGIVARIPDGISLDLNAQPEDSDDNE